MLSEKFDSQVDLFEECVMVNNSINFSIVTVVKNDISGLIRSRLSLEAQDFEGWRHIIVDANSNDGTLEYISSLPSENTTFISESDDGIYDAMNKGWQLAADNSFILYLNARDEFTDRHALSMASIALQISENVTWGCTTHEESYEDGSNWVCKLVSKPSVSNQLYAFGYRSHQAILMKKSLIEHLGGFNLNLKISADWDLIVRALLFQPPIVWNYPIVRFELGGMSSSRLLEAHLELKALRRKYLNHSFTQRIFDDIWCAIYLEYFGFTNYASRFLKLIKPKKKAQKTKGPKNYIARFKIPIITNTITLQLSIDRKKSAKRNIYRQSRRSEDIYHWLIRTLRIRLDIYDYNSGSSDKP
jgi:glycosyltransferase involved in cell wall biosynthesis